MIGDVCTLEQLASFPDLHPAVCMYAAQRVSIDRTANNNKSSCWKSNTNVVVVVVVVINPPLRRLICKGSVADRRLAGRRKI